MEKISKNFFKGCNITDPYEILRLAKESKSIYHYNWGIKPAAFFLSQQTRFILTMLEQDKLFYTIKNGTK